MKQPIVNVDGTYYNVTSASWTGGNVDNFTIHKDGNVLTIFAPNVLHKEWTSLSGSRQKGYVTTNYTVEFVEEVTS